MKIRNDSGHVLEIADILIRNAQGNSYGLKMSTGATATIFDEDAEKSTALKTLLLAGTVVKVGDAEPQELDLFTADDTTKVVTSAINLKLAPAIRPVGAYAYLFQIDGSDIMTGGAATKTYAIGVSVTRPLGSGATGDSNDAVLEGSYSNYAVNDTNFIIRGINASTANRSGGLCGQLDNLLGSAGRSGGTVGTITGLTVVPENYGTVSNEFGGIKVQLKNEGAVATLQYGIKVENLDNSTGNAVTSAILVADTGTNTGFTVGLNLEGATLAKQIAFSTGTYITCTGTTIVFQNGAKTATMDLTAGTLAFA